MSLYQTAKTFVPLEWRIGFRKHRFLPNDLATRVFNRLQGNSPIPPADLIYLVAGHRSAKTFLEGGRLACNAIREILRKNQLDVEEFASVLDFGCGVGRIIRHWTNTRGPAWHGTDYNPQLIEWCKDHLKYAEFRINTLSAQLPYASESFDFIYSFSVFTHLDETLQHSWLNELLRVLKPGGYIYLTTHGEHYLSMLTTEERAQFESGKLVVREQDESGSNACAAFHPLSYIRDTLARDLIVVDFVPCGSSGHSMQDVHLLKKPF
jgi:SAM-dependent methyltransferase